MSDHEEEPAAAASKSPEVEAQPAAPAKVEKGGLHKYDYLVLLTFEPSCDREATSIEEIVELSWTSIDVRSLEISEPSKKFIKTDAELSEERAERLQMSEDDLDSAVSLDAAIQKLNSDLYLQFTAKDRTFCFVGASAWDIKSCLFSNAVLKKLKLASHFHRFFDLLVEFKTHLSTVEGASKATSLNDMCSHFGIAKPESRTSCADAVISMGAIVKRLLIEGHRFNSPIVLPETFDPFNASTSSTDPSSTSSKKDDTPSESSRVVWIRGLPWQTSGDDVKAFFNGLDVDQIQFNVNPNGRMNGEAYVIFTTKEQAAAAMTRYNRKMIGHRYVEVFQSSQVDFDYAQRRARAMGASDTIGRDGVAGGSGQRGVLMVKLRGLPYSVREADIYDFLRGVKIPSDGIRIMRFPDGRITGEAFVEITVENDLATALAKHKALMDSRYIEVFRSSSEEMRQAESRAVAMGGHVPRHERMGGDRGSYRPSSSSYGGGGNRPGYADTSSLSPAARAAADMYGDVFVRLRGLPFASSEHDIMQFFSQAQVTPIGIQILQDPQNRASGEAFVQFASPDEARRSLARHRGYMGQRYVEVFHASPQEVMAVVGVPGGAAAAAAYTGAAAAPYTGAAAAPYTGAAAAAPYTGGATVAQPAQYTGAAAAATPQSGQYGSATVAQPATGQFPPPAVPMGYPPGGAPQYGGAYGQNAAYGQPPPQQQQYGGAYGQQQFNPAYRQGYGQQQQQYQAPPPPPPSQKPPPPPSSSSSSQQNDEGRYGKRARYT